MLIRPTMYISVGVLGETGTQKGIPGSEGFTNGPVPRAHEIREKKTTDQEKFIAASRLHIGAGKWTWVAFWRPTNRVKQYLHLDNDISIYMDVFVRGNGQA